MARENRRARLERRLGRPERLADIAREAEAGLNSWLADSGDRETLASCRAAAEFARARLGVMPVVVADNVCEYYFTHERKTWAFRDDFPAIYPPFPEFFVEMGRPSRVVEGPVVSDARRWAPPRWGWAFVAGRPGRFAEDVPDMVGPGRLDVGGAEWVYTGHLVQLCQSGLVDFTSMVAFFCSDASGRVAADPLVTMFGGDLIPEVERADLGTYALCLLKPALLAISFMNCKNVSMPVIEPDRALNRERRKAGAKPFVRYRTINIEPMKAVLRSEGDVDSVGLRRALHLCRSHFATYTTSFMGRPLEKPITVVRPAHVRGSAASGIVVSDYRVGPPAVKES